MILTSKRSFEFAQVSNTQLSELDQACEVGRGLKVEKN